MAARYEQTLREQQGNSAKEDFSDMVAEHAAKQKVTLFINFSERIVTLIFLIFRARENVSSSKPTANSQRNTKNSSFKCKINVP